MELSSTWFLRAFSLEMWICTFIAYICVFFGFFLSVFLYRKLSYNQHVLKLWDILVYMWTFYESRTIKPYRANSCFWKVQMINFSILQIITAAGFSTFLTTLMSTKYFSIPFKELADYARIRSHHICISIELAPMSFFGKRINHHTMEYSQE